MYIKEGGGGVMSNIHQTGEGWLLDPAKRWEVALEEIRRLKVASKAGNILGGRGQSRSHRHRAVWCDLATRGRH